MPRSRLVLMAIALAAIASLVVLTASPRRDAVATGSASKAPPTGATQSPGAAAPPSDHSAVNAPTATTADARPSADDPNVKAMTAALGAPLPPADSAVVDIFDALQDRARGGDLRASCRLALELQRCSTARVTEQTASNIEGEIARAERTPDNAVNQLARMQSTAQQQGRGCAGLDESHFRHAFDLQLQTALRDPTARLWFALNPALDPWNFVNDLERWTVYRQHAMPWLEEAAARGEPAALIALARVHGDLRRVGPPWPRFRIADPERFLVYAELMARQGIRFTAVTRDVARIRNELDADALRRIDERVAALHRPDRPLLGTDAVAAALEQSMRRIPTPGDCAKAQ